MHKVVFGGRSFAAFLFDMDGTLLSSIEAAERVWADWATRHGLDVATFLPTIHGVRTVETIRRLALPGVDAEAEAEKITGAELTDVDGVRPIAGAGAFLESLPEDRWAIVTSAPRKLAQRRLAAAGLRAPAVFITAEDVKNGKPQPDGYLLAAKELGFEAQNCLVFEDSAAGIEAAERAGASVLVVRAPHTPPVTTAHISAASYEALDAIADESGCLVLRCLYCELGSESDFRKK
ncbi:MAG TPA: HAD-IA family hydrolase [Steroidobacteraceae bacterium]